MKSGNFSLQPFYEYAQDQIEPVKGEGRGNIHPSWRGYMGVRKALMVGVPRSATGWYAWVKVEKLKTRVVYVGKSTEGKLGGLYDRLYDHFKREPPILLARRAI